MRQTLLVLLWASVSACTSLAPTDNVNVDGPITDKITEQQTTAIVASTHHTSLVDDTTSPSFDLSPLSLSTNNHFFSDEPHMPFMLGALIGHHEHSTTEAEAPTDEPQDLWHVIREGLSFDIPEHKRVIQERRWYASHQKYLDRVAERAKPYLYFIVQEIQARDLPLELALLPIVESAFDPFAYSHGRASGIWQFIPGTGKHYGLKQNWWYDGRRDIIASTRAALDYLTYLHRYFKGDWMHALAAYNSGEGNVRKAIRRNKKRGKAIDFWSLKLPRETQAYVPKLLALSDLLKRSESFNLKWQTIENKQAIEVVNISQQMDLANAAQMAGLSIEALHRLNPAFNQWATDPEGPHYLVLPVTQAALFKQSLAESKADPVKWIRYTIKSGDNLIKIAKKFLTTSQLLQQVNHLKSNRIRQGKKLLVPVAAKKLDAYPLTASNRVAKKKSRGRGTKIIHRVKSGDTFWDLAKAYKVSSRSLAKWNGMAPRDPLRINQELVIWVKATPQASSTSNMTKKVRYTVRRGDSLDRISNKFRVRINDVVRWNKLDRDRFLQPGQKLTLFVDLKNQYDT